MSPVLAPSYGVDAVDNQGAALDNTRGWLPPQGDFATITAWGTANRAIYVPLRITRADTVVKLAYNNGTTATGNIDIGLYNAAGTRLVSKGSTAKSAVGDVVIVDVTDTVVQPGLYYIALNNSTTTDTFSTYASVTAPLPMMWGLRTEALGSVTLPASASWSFDQTLAFVPGVYAVLAPELA